MPAIGSYCIYRLVFTNRHNCIGKDLPDGAISINKNPRASLPIQSCTLYSYKQSTIAVYYPCLQKQEWKSWLLVTVKLLFPAMVAYVEQFCYCVLVSAVILLVRPFHCLGWKLSQWSTVTVKLYFNLVGWFCHFVLSEATHNLNTVK